MSFDKLGTIRFSRTCVERTRRSVIRKSCHGPPPLVRSTQVLLSNPLTIRWHLCSHGIVRLEGEQIHGSRAETSSSAGTHTTCVVGLRLPLFGPAFRKTRTPPDSRKQELLGRLQPKGLEPPQRHLVPVLRLLRQPQVPQAGKQGLEDHSPFKPRQRRAQAVVDASSKGKMVGG